MRAIYMFNKIVLFILLISVSAVFTTATAEEFAIERIYLKKALFEAPNSPAIFTKEWTPKTNLRLDTKVTPLSGDSYEVELTIKITVKSDGKVAFIADVNQAGVFKLVGYPEEQRNQLLASYCPSYLFPYAREAIASLVDKGSFPEMKLAPINFDALYEQRQNQEKTQ